MNKKLLLALTILFLGSLSFSQSTTIGQGVFVANTYGPMYTTPLAGSVSRFAYIYSESLLGNLQHGDSISSVVFFKDLATGTLSGANNLKIYIRPTNKQDFGTGILSWTNELSGTGFQKVFDGNPNLSFSANSDATVFKFDFPYHWDTSFGRNMELLIEYAQGTAQTSAIQWLYDNQTTQNGYLPNQAKYFVDVNNLLGDSLNQTNERKPKIQINYPRTDVEIAAQALYSLGRIPAPLGNPDTVKVLLYNGGKKDVVNRKAYLSSIGANIFEDTLTFSLEKNTQKLFAFPVRHITNTGMDTLQVVLEPDAITGNDTITNLREATEFIYSYRNLTEPPSPGGIGFNGATGDFVAKFLSSQPKAINQIRVTFGMGNQPFRIGIWDASGANGTPGTLLWESANSTSTGGDFIMPVWPPVTVSGTFFVGVRQTGLNNVAFGYQNENPVRNGTFFYTSPLGSSNWVDFAPASPFRFLIEPRIQAENDVTPLSVHFPSDTLITGTFDTIAPKATIRNIGVSDQSTPFEIKCNIRYFGGQLMYTSSVFDTLSAGSTRLITFDSSFFPTFSGEYTVDIITLLPSDQFKQNDTFRYSILCGRYSDVGVVTVFVPGNGATFQFGTDTLYPTVRADNFGFDTRSFAITAEIYDDNDSLVWQETTTRTITGGQSATVGFFDFIPHKTGAYRFVSYTRLPDDTDRKNDTIQRVFFVAIDNDVAPNFSLTPSPNQVYPAAPSPVSPELNIKNLGDLHQMSMFPAYCFIYRNEQLVFTDTTELQVFIGDSSTVTFPKGFSDTEEGHYKIIFVTALTSDQNRKNDTLILHFRIGLENDIEVVSLTEPDSDSILNLSEVYQPKVLVRNNGFKNQFTPFNLTLQSIDSSGTVVQTMQRIMTIAAGSTEEFEFDNAFQAKPEGVIQVRVFTSLPDDEIPSNDTLSVSFSISKTYDLELLGNIPNNSEEIILQHTESYIPQLIIQNNSRLTSDSGFVTLLMWNPANEPVYNYTQKALPALSGGVDTLTFPPVIPNKTGEYKALASIFYSLDQNPFNDTFEFVFTSILKHDLALAAIAAPAQNDTFYLDTNPPSHVALTVQNKGTDTANNAFLEIFLFDHEDMLLKTDSLSFSLTPAVSQNIIFQNFLQGIDLGTDPFRKITAKVSYTQDQILENNELTNTFYLFASVSAPVIPLGNAITVSPNPFANTIEIQLKETQKYTLELLSADGKTVHRTEIKDGETSLTLQTESLAAGVYYLKLNNGKHIFAGKLIKL